MKRQFPGKPVPNKCTADPIHRWAVRGFPSCMWQASVLGQFCLLSCGNAVGHFCVRE